MLDEREETGDTELFYISLSFTHFAGFNGRPQTTSHWLAQDATPAHMSILARQQQCLKALFPEHTQRRATTAVYACYYIL
jgi:hypothetical protein